LLGGPGSNKSLLSSTSVKLHHSKLYDWVSVGQLLRSRPDMDKVIRKGELAPDKVVLELVTEFMRKSRKRRFVIDGFPRTTTQADLFREKVGC
jgi:adenylate kinase family enzyme